MVAVAVEVAAARAPHFAALSSGDAVADIRSQRRANARSRSSAWAESAPITSASAPTKAAVPK